MRADLDRVVSHMGGVGGLVSATRPNFRRRARAIGVARTSGPHASTSFNATEVRSNSLANLNGYRLTRFGRGRTTTCEGMACDSFCAGNVANRARPNHQLDTRYRFRPVALLGFSQRSVALIACQKCNTPKYS
jgi:hypothetical protein